MITQLSDSTLGRYNLREKVGSGATACVYRAIDPDLKREVALKVLPSNAAEDGASIDRFRQEAKAVASLSHPNILQVFDLGED
jgi:serine/threonine protein kinase